jgi:hypothetical protein
MGISKLGVIGRLHDSYAMPVAKPSPLTARAWLRLLYCDTAVGQDGHQQFDTHWNLPICSHGLSIAKAPPTVVVESTPLPNAVQASARPRSDSNACAVASEEINGRRNGNHFDRGLLLYRISAQQFLTMVRVALGLIQ